MSDKSTPRPWRVVEPEVLEDGSIYDRHIVSEPIGWHVVSFVDEGSLAKQTEEVRNATHERDIANATLIVRAVNQSDHVAELVGAANVALAAIVNPQMFNLETVETTVRLALAHFTEVTA